MEEDLVYPYGTRLHGANFRDNRFVLSLPSGGSSPKVPDIKVKYSPRKGRGVKISRKDGSEVFDVSGYRRATSESVAMPYPAKAMRQEITDRLASYGISVEGNDVKNSDQCTLLYSHRSPALADIMRSLMFRSDNMMAEATLRALTPGRTRKEALAEQSQIWADLALVPYKVNLVDGSGLSRNDRLTGRFMMSLLQAMSLGEQGRTYQTLFPRAGLEVTLKYFLSETALEGLVAMKTGSMKGVQSYAGYLFDEETGRPTHAIVFIANDFRCSRSALKGAFQRLLLNLFVPQEQIETNENFQDNETRLLPADQEND